MPSNQHVCSTCKSQLEPSDTCSASQGGEIRLQNAQGLFVSLLASSLYSLFLRCRGDGVLPESFLPLQWRRQLSVVASTRAVRQQTRPFFSTNRSVRVMRFPLTD